MMCCRHPTSMVVGGVGLRDRGLGRVAGMFEKRFTIRYRAAQRPDHELAELS